jgi:hypothetical protein
MRFMSHFHFAMQEIFQTSSSRYRGPPKERGDRPNTAMHFLPVAFNSVSLKTFAANELLLGVCLRWGKSLFGKPWQFQIRGCCYRQEDGHIKHFALQKEIWLAGYKSKDTQLHLLGEVIAYYSHKNKFFLNFLCHLLFFWSGQIFRFSFARSKWHTKRHSCLFPYSFIPLHCYLFRASLSFSPNAY